MMKTLFKTIPTDNITELNYLIYAETKAVRNLGWQKETK